VPKYLILCLLMFPHLVNAQHALSRGSRGSDYTYRYSITNEEARQLYKRPMRPLNEKLLHTLVDSFLTTSKNLPNQIPAGNYLYVRADGGALQMRHKLIYNIYVKVLNNSRDLVVVLEDEKGTLVSDATVQLGSRQLQYDGATSSFRLDKCRREGLLLVTYKGVLNGFSIEKDTRYYTRSAWNKFKYAFPVKYITHLVQNISKCIIYGGYDDAYANNFRGFMVCSKPRYKPGDTVQLKAFITTVKGTPVNEPLFLRLTGSTGGFSTDTILTTVYPYRPGGYTYSFVLTDSLQMKLDKDYRLTLERERKHAYFPPKILMAGGFKLEAYELKAVTFTARTDKKVHTPGDLASLYVKAVDENEMPVMDGRVKIWILANQVNKYHTLTTFVPDTLWYHTQAMDALGETRILLPDSIFPMASLSYKIACQFLNSNNESQDKTLQQEYVYQREQINFELVADSLDIRYTESGKVIPTTGMLYAYNINYDTQQVMQVPLPATIKLIPNASRYELKTKGISKAYAFENETSLIQCLGSRNKDSVRVQVENPRDLPFWYTIFAGNKVVLRGYGQQLYWEGKSITPQHYFVSLQYFWQGRSQKEEAVIPYSEKALKITVAAPEYVYPGQKAHIGITVEDAVGQPVEDADITAYAATKKFSDARMPFLPYLGKVYPNRKQYHTFKMDGADEAQQTQRLNWERWGNAMQLREKEYYQLIHQPGVYTFTEPVKDSLTQIAPFVVKEGVLQTVHILYIDEVPVYFSQANQERRYSFRVSPGRHSLRIRTYNREVKVDSILVQEGVKTFYRFNVDQPDQPIRVKKMPVQMTKAEQQLINQYTIQVSNQPNENFAYITQRQNVYWLQNRGVQLVGPLTRSDATYTVIDQYAQEFQPEQDNTFDIRNGHIRQWQRPGTRYPFGSLLGASAWVDNLADSVLTEQEVLRSWKAFQDNLLLSFPSDRLSLRDKTFNGRLQLQFPKELFKEPDAIKHLFLFRYDDALFLRTMPGTMSYLSNLESGQYRLLVMMKDDQYFIRDSISIQDNGINFYEIIPANIQPGDSMSHAMSQQLFDAWNANTNIKNWTKPATINETFNQRYFDESSLTRTINGYITDVKGAPLIGVSVFIDGTNRGTATDATGRFTLRVTDRGILRVSYIGFITQRLALNDSNYYSCMLSESRSAMEEVVVVGYGTTRRQNMTASITTVTGTQLAGKLAGISTGRRGGLHIRLRGNRMDSNAPPLIIIDGLPFNGDMSGVDPGTITYMQILNSSDAVALYGERGAAGVILITTNRAIASSKDNGTDLASGALSLRQNFRDNAFWQPMLRTDKAGKTGFEVTFPDDITNWRTTVLGITDHQQTGTAETYIKSMKTLTATLGLPAFALQGDALHIIGKAMNYNTDSITVTRLMAVNDSVYRKGEIGFKNMWIDTLGLKIGTKDSLSFRYVIRKADGYYDGEVRSIPVFQQGVLETDGFFAALRKDTSFRLSLPVSREPVKVYAETAVLPVLLEEMKSIQRYEYLCNEQLASKLQAYLMEQKVRAYLKEPFKGEKSIREIIRQLERGKSAAAGWGWWPENTPMAWISNHALKALLEAEAQGYKITLDKQLMLNNTVFELEAGGKEVDSLSLLEVLHQLKASLDYKSITEQLLKNKGLSFNDRLRVIQLQQQRGLPVKIAEGLFSNPTYTMMGNMYWGSEKYQLFDNSIQNTLLVYKIARAAGGRELMLEKIRGYFLEQRKNGSWRNTYESTLILETILPDLLQEQSTTPASLTIIGDSTFTVTKFPYAGVLSSTTEMQIRKQGDRPLYFTAYRQRWNTRPESAGHQFSVQTTFMSGNKAITTLKSGEPVLLKAEVTVAADADYVMIEIPIPAGCSYQSKPQSWRNNEVHREYFKQKVSIFCQRLTKGTYTFEVSLLPRYTGQYHLNPAKGEMMYFPVFYGREGMKEVGIE
jgi:hypothetical protein